jgi:hypothetical protein
MITRILLGALACWSVMSTALAAVDLRPYAYRRAVTSEEANDDELLAVPLDASVYAHSQTDFADLRLVSGQGYELPYRLNKATDTRTETRRETFTGKVASLRILAGNRVEILVDLPSKAPDVEGLAIVTPLRDFEQRVRVSGETAGGGWQPLLESTYIFDYSRIMDVHNNELKLPTNQCRRFKVEIENVIDQSQSPFYEIVKQQGANANDFERVRRQVRERPFRVDQIRFWRTVPREVSRQERRMAYPPLRVNRRVDEKHRQTVIEVETNREPLTSFLLETEQRNFSRQIRVEIPVLEGGMKAWRTLAKSRISRLRFREISREEMRISFPETRQSQFRIVIENGERQPVQITAVNPEGPIYRLLLVMAQRQRVDLVYGDPAAKPPAHDWTTIDALLAKGYAPRDGQLGPEEANAEQSRTWNWRRGLGSRWFFFFAVAAMIAVLGWALVRAGHRIKSLEDDA